MRTAAWRNSRRRLDGEGSPPRRSHNLPSLRAHLRPEPTYDLRKLKGHCLLERDGSRYASRLTSKGVQVALLFLFFHKRLCGPLANTAISTSPDPQHRPHSRLEAAYHRADKAIEKCRPTSRRSLNGKTRQSRSRFV